LVIVAAIECSSFVFAFRVGGQEVASESLPDAAFRNAPHSGKASVDAGPKDVPAVNLASLQKVCQWEKARFHRFFAVFFGFLQEKAGFLGFAGLRGTESVCSAA
jgi:hypothetical protein